jgi:diaminohydroxyphosphoribosylaminopyrimidine deaminase/5-amino-6-(5-phosphoribosylamino)uracil reductase
MRVTLKLATSLDGRIATASGESKWITGEAARAQGHRLRAEHDAILVGVETVLIDDPELTVRLSSPAASGNPLRVILDSRLRTPDSAKVAAANTLILTTAAPRSVGQAEVERVADAGRPDPEAVLAALSRRGLTSVLIEGGGQVAASFLRAGLVDRIEWFRSSILLGGDGRPGVAGLELAKLGDAPKFRRLSVEALGDDLWERYERI